MNNYIRYNLLICLIFISGCGGKNADDSTSFPEMEYNNISVDQNTLLYRNFENQLAGIYTTTSLFNDWNIVGSHIGIDEERVSVLTDSDPRLGNTLRITYPKGLSSDGKSQWKHQLDTGHDELYCLYRIKFDKNFEFVKGGKLPGFAGGTANTGGNKPDGTDGWSGRVMWRSLGKLVQYVYHPDQPKTTGEDFDWSFTAETDIWYQVETRIKMNTPQQHNGIVESWINGQKVLSRENIRFRDTDQFSIDIFYFSTFFGGSDPSWAPSKDTYIYLDDFVISTTSISTK